MRYPSIVIVYYFTFFCTSYYSPLIYDSEKWQFSFFLTILNFNNITEYTIDYLRVVSCAFKSGPRANVPSVLFPPPIIVPVTRPSLTWRIVCIWRPIRRPRTFRWAGGRVRGNTTTVAAAAAATGCGPVILLPVCCPGTS